MGRPSKSTDVLANEKKSHRTKAEMNRRAEAEKALSTGVALKERPEVAENPVAHKEFLRVNALLSKIEKNDAIIEPIINRYCMLQAECIEFEKKREKFSENLDAMMDDRDVESETRYRLATQMQKTIVDVDKQIQSKRKMLFDIEKENAMTIASAMRSIPKQIDTKENPLMKALSDDG